MAYNSYPNGTGGLTGADLAVNKPIYVGGTGHIWHVSSVLGTDAASPRGRERERPLATLGQAYTNAASGDQITLMENHAETIAATITVGKALTIVSEGTGSTRARLTDGVAFGAMLVLGTVGTTLNNIYFPASTAATTARISVTATSGVWCDGCYFECGAQDLVTTILFGAVDSCRLSNAYFLATASQPAIAINCPSTMHGLFLDNVTLDGGSFGFSAFAFTAAGTLLGTYANRIHQLNNADVSLANGWTGVWNVGNTSGSARFEG